MERLFLICAGVNGFLAVALGAFGAHALRNKLSAAADATRLLEVWETATRHHMAHALALGLVAYLAARGGGQAASLAGYLFLAGITLFSGSLYALGLGLRMLGPIKLGPITPLGGLCLLAGWVCVVLAARKLS